MCQSTDVLAKQSRAMSRTPVSSNSAWNSEPAMAKVVADILELQGHNYLLAIDQFPEVLHLADKMAITAVVKLKAHLHTIAEPKEIICDHLPPTRQVMEEFATN